MEEQKQIEVQSLNQTVEFLLATITYNSNYPKVYFMKDSDQGRIENIGFRQAMIPKDEEEIIVALENMYQMKQNNFLEKIGLSILDEQAIMSLKEAFHSKISTYGQECIGSSFLAKNKVLLKYPEEKIMEYVEDGKKELLEDGKEFTNIFLQELFMLRLSKIEDQKGLSKVMKRV